MRAIGALAPQHKRNLRCCMAARNDTAAPLSSSRTILIYACLRACCSLCSDATSSSTAYWRAYQRANISPLTTLSLRRQTALYDIAAADDASASLALAYLLRHCMTYCCAFSVQHVATRTTPRLAPLCYIWRGAPRRIFSPFLCTCRHLPHRRMLT